MRTKDETTACFFLCDFLMKKNEHMFVVLKTGVKKWIKERRRTNIHMKKY